VVAAGTFLRLPLFVFRFGFVIGTKSYAKADTLNNYQIQMMLDARVSLEKQLIFSKKICERNVSFFCFCFYTAQNLKP
jgi:hypothetical protein